MSYPGFVLAYGGASGWRHLTDATIRAARKATA